MDMWMDVCGCQDYVCPDVRTNYECPAAWVYAMWMYGLWMYRRMHARIMHVWIMDVWNTDMRMDVWRYGCMDLV